MFVGRGLLSPPCEIGLKQYQLQIYNGYSVVNTHFYLNHKLPADSPTYLSSNPNNIE